MHFLNRAALAGRRDRHWRWCLWKNGAFSAPGTAADHGIHHRGWYPVQFRRKWSRPGLSPRGKCATVKVIGTDGDWLKVILPEKIGYVYSGYMTVSDGEGWLRGGSFSGRGNAGKSAGMLGGGLNGGAALTPDGNLSLIDNGNEKRQCVLSRSTVTTRARKLHFLNQWMKPTWHGGWRKGGNGVCTCRRSAGAVIRSPVCIKI